MTMMMMTIVLTVVDRREYHSDDDT